MNLNSQQFKHVIPSPTPPIKPLPAAVSKNYQELAHFINLQIKQKRLDAQTCYPWELDCDPPPGLKALVDKFEPGISRRYEQLT